MNKPELKISYLILMKTGTINSIDNFSEDVFNCRRLSERKIINLIVFLHSVFLSALWPLHPLFGGN